MSLIALLLSLSNVSGALALSTPSNGVPPGNDSTGALVVPASEAPDLESAGGADTTTTPRNEFAARPLTIESRLGVGAPTGFFGGAISYSPIPALGLDCGLGKSNYGLQLACGLRARLLLGSLGALTPGFTPGSPTLSPRGLHRALTLTSGVSSGPYVDDHVLEKFTWVDGPGPASRSYPRAYWWNTDIGVEERYESLVLRFFLGAALLTNPSAGTDLVTHGERIERPSTSLFYFGFGLGLAP